MAAVLTAHVLTAKPLIVGIVSAVADGIEVSVIAGLVQRFFGPTFRLNRMRQVIGLLAAAIAGICLSALGGMIASRLQFTPPVDSVLTSFLDWVASNTIGVFVVAPLVIGIADGYRDPPPLREVIEGTAGITVLAIVAGVVVLLPPNLWRTFVPIAWLIPVFTWIAGRCRPVCVAAGVFVVCITIVSTAIFGIGHFGPVDGAGGNRIVEARVAIFVVALGALFLGALFAERRENEARLTHANTLLERERDNKLMNLEAALASISHEIQQPLTTISANGMVAQHLLALDPPDLQSARDAMIDVQQASTATSQLLENLRQLFGKRGRLAESTDINDLVRAAVQLLAKNLNDHRVTVVLQLSDDLAPIEVHRGQLQEVLVNLAQNAIESMATVEGRVRTLTLRTTRDTNTVVIDVTDTGPGISPTHADTIFDAFVTTKSAGLGLGLAICKAIVERHGGTLTASSDREDGAVFRIVLPLEPAV